MSHKMDYRFGTGWTLFILLISVISAEPEVKQLNETTNELQNNEFENKTDENWINDSYTSSLDKRSDPFYGNAPQASHPYQQRYHNPSVAQYMNVMYGSHTYNYRQPYNERPNYNNIYQAMNAGGNYPNSSNLYSPYQIMPGSYQKNAYNKLLYNSGKQYSAQSIYSSYLANGAYLYSSAKCANHYGQTPHLTAQDLDSAFDYARHQLSQYEQMYGNYTGYVNSSPLKLKEKEALLMEYVTEYFAKYKCFSKYQISTFLPLVVIGPQYTQNRYGDTSCYSSYGLKNGWNLDCPDYNSKYRTVDGSCNNLKHPYWGKAYVCHLRFLSPDYADGVQAPRVAYDGSPLPNARLLSNVIVSDKPFLSIYNRLTVAFGQIVKHDISHTASYGDNGDPPLDCCKYRHNKQCYAIDIPPTPDDYQYRNYNNTCISFTRSAPCPLCDLGPRQQLNQASSFIDGSTLYGYTVNDSIAIRTFKSGLLKTSKDKYGKPILLSTSNPYQGACSAPVAGMQCFHSGDKRVNQHPSLQVMNLVYSRRHNQHAIALQMVNPYWSDEVLFQESRRLVMAELQYTVYKEYLPIILGNTLMDYYSLKVSDYGYTNYEPYTDPTSWIEFAVAAGRFGHSTINGWHSLRNEREAYNSSKGYWLRDRYNDPQYLWDGKVCKFI